MRGTEVSASDLYRSHADLGDGRLKTAADLFTDWYSRHAHARGAGHDGPGADWRLIRAAEASAREIGIRASTPDQAAAGTPEYAADPAQWGSGRGIGPDGPETRTGPEAGE